MVPPFKQVWAWDWRQEHVTQLLWGDKNPGQWLQQARAVPSPPHKGLEQPPECHRAPWEKLGFCALRSLTAREQPADVPTTGQGLREGRTGGKHRWAGGWIPFWDRGHRWETQGRGRPLGLLSQRPLGCWPTPFSSSPPFCSPPTPPGPSPSIPGGSPARGPLGQSPCAPRPMPGLQSSRSPNTSVDNHAWEVGRGSGERLLCLETRPK